MLELVDQLLAFLLGDRAVEPHVLKLVPLEDRLDEIEHRGPLGEEHGLAVLLVEKLLDQLFQPLEFR